jgi:hypothetical protein
MNKAALIFTSLALSFSVLLLLLGLPGATAHPVYAAPLAPATDVSGHITQDTTWDLAGSPYIVTGDVTVDAGFTLTIDPGVQVRFNGLYMLTVLGTLAAEGEAGQPVVFTSNLGTPAPGDWGVIDFRSSSAYNRLRHVTLEYGGNTSRPGAGCVAGLVCASTTSLLIDSVLFQHSATRGLVLVQSSAEIINSTFTSNPYEAIRLHNCDLAVGECHPIILGNLFTYNLYPVLQISPQNPVLGNNSASGNQVNGYVFYIMCNVGGHNTFYADDLPYVIPAAGAACEAGIYNRPTTIEIQPGTVFKLANTLQFNYNTVITATGTTDQPIIFTSLKDDSVGGNDNITSDTNNDGSATTPSALDWGSIRHWGTEVRGLYEHVLFRYGGEYGAWGPLLASAGGANVTVRQSEFSYSRVGATIENNSHLSFLQNNVHDMSVFGIYDNSSTGSVLIEGNRFTDITGDGVNFERSQAVIRDNFFQGTINGVRVKCTSTILPCSPVVSPNNRFVGDGQTGMYMNHPDSVCVQAFNNWWGDVNGPSDASAASDACGLETNIGLGAPVTNGVNYSPWIGGMSRPAIVAPRCGLTSVDQPEVIGYASPGSLVSLYDGQSFLGQITADSRGVFTYTLSTPLTDGLHALHAAAELGGQTSLPSAAITYDLDSSLPFEPAGLKLSYEFHSQVYTLHLLNDGFGCTSLSSIPDMPMWVRPGSYITVTVPIASQAALASLFPPAPSTSITNSRQVLPGSPEFSSPNSSEDLVIPFNNFSEGTITDVSFADRRNGSVYNDHQMINILDVKDTGTGQFTVPDDVHIEVRYWSGNTLVQRSEYDTSGPVIDNVMKPHYNRHVEFNNNTGRPLTGIYISLPSEIGTDAIGGSYVSPQSPILPEKSASYDLPWQDNYSDYSSVVIKDDQGVYYIRQFLYGPVDNKGRKFTLQNPGTASPTVFTNDLGKDICQLRLVKHEKDQDGRLQQVIGMPVNMLELLNTSTIPKETSFLLKLEPGRYFVYAETCDHSVKIFRMWTEVGGQVSIRECEGSGWLQLNEKRQLFQISNQPQNLTTNSSADFQIYQARLPFEEGSLGVTICSTNDSGEHYIYEVIGYKPMLIDPDGYVYNAVLGFGVKVPGATVSCDVYDEDYQSWNRWPAELYESQVNPQVTHTDGYYAFFVPPGKYRVTATAPRYQPHTSPVIEVVNEIVHYNIPLASLLKLIYLPLALRP